MKKKILTTAILLTGLSFATTYHYTFKVNDVNLFKSYSNNQPNLNDPIMQNSTPIERTYIQSDGRILASDAGIDWYGEVSAESFVTGIQLASLLNFNSGTNINSDAGWLHVGIDGQELLIAKKPFKHSITYGSQLESQNLVLGNRTITIGDNQYKIRLLNGYGSNRSGTVRSGYDSIQSHGSEWNRIMYRLTNENYSNSSNRKISEGEFLNLAYYNEDDLGIGGSNAGRRNWTYKVNTNHIWRGLNGVSSIVVDSSSGSTNISFGWRPVLEKIN